ncbi:hypothetical protein K443DRAFT_3638 [Laccaria amethystina LaAM-08-1]|uniref:Uncharacterized protein n=1 Tax=Laccaria amethystina LaAM-08-1 TaxID=1095629 RepID=A0A0C9X0L3_9AGAR|nr:hypothetical protein K443DRAFT_3638 [Laccaria amethystina LaAM-08-1]
MADRSLQFKYLGTREGLPRQKEDRSSGGVLPSHRDEGEDHLPRHLTSVDVQPEWAADSWYRAGQATPTLGSPVNSSPPKALPTSAAEHYKSANTSSWAFAEDERQELAFSELLGTPRKDQQRLSTESMKVSRAFVFNGDKYKSNFSISTAICNMPDLADTSDAQGRRRPLDIVQVGLTSQVENDLNQKF